MKLHISQEQLNQLSKEGKERLRKWWKPNLGNRVFSQPNNGTVKGSHYKVLGTVIKLYKYDEVGIEFENCWLPIQKKRILPLLSIGQMIEFLEERNWPFLKIEQGKKLDKDVEIDNWEVITVNPDDEYEAEELCDALWEAVKEVLEK